MDFKLFYSNFSEILERSSDKYVWLICHALKDIITSFQKKMILQLLAVFLLRCSQSLP